MNGENLVLSPCEKSLQKIRGKFRTPPGAQARTSLYAPGRLSRIYNADL
jgi:hypothetical protein